MFSWGRKERSGTEEDGEGESLPPVAIVALINGQKVDEGMFLSVCTYDKHIQMPSPAIRSRCSKVTQRCDKRCCCDAARLGS
jgi:hypothetical protein